MKAKTPHKGPKKVKPKRKPQIPVDSSSESDTVISLRESDVSEDSMSEFDIPIISAAPDVLLDSDTINSGDYVMIKSKTSSYFVGQIINCVDSQDFDCKFLRRCQNYFVFPNIEDISQVGRADIHSKLSPPTQMAGTSRMAARYVFDINLNNVIIR